ncbi:unnamed protein product [Diamesa serratosioi]
MILQESLEEYESRLYSMVYHDSSIEATFENSADMLPINLNKQKPSRYWLKSKNMSNTSSDMPEGVSKHYTPSDTSQIKPPYKARPSIEPKSPVTPLPTTMVSTITKFVPYSSYLSCMNTAMDKPTEIEPVATTYEKKKSKAKLPISKGKVLNPLSKSGITKSKELQRAQVQVKKEKAINARKKHQQRVLATIDLNSSEDEESNDDVIPIELPPPPFINLDTSDEEDLAHQIRKISRPVSPSNSSIVSDDFIVSGDKSRLIDAFRIEAMNVRGSANKNKQNKDAMQKLKSVSKQSTSFVLNSDRISALDIEDRNNEHLTDKAIKTKSYSKERRSIEDSIYGAKLSTSTPKRSKDCSDAETSEDESCVSTKKQKVRRRKSTGSRSVGKDSENEESDVDMNPKQKLISSTPLGKTPAKRSRFISSNYNDDEFASMISSIIRKEDSNDGEEESSEDRTEVGTVVEISDSRVIEESDDCRIIEKLIPVVDIPDDEDSDSDASMKADRTPVVCDLSLNVLENTFEPHEIIRDHDPLQSSIANIDHSIDVLEDPEIGWNDEMRYFYNRSWGGEDFYIGEMLNSMTRNPREWPIANNDRVRMFDPQVRARCLNCNEFGHMKSKCKRPRKKLLCYMCGEEGHRETRCPNTICLRCGKQNRIFSNGCNECNRLNKKVCPLCKFRGHDIDTCPDKWRRYHSTVSEDTGIVNNVSMNRRVYCSICSRRGHFAENCGSVNKMMSGLTITTSYIVSHKISYPKQYHLDNVEEMNSPNRQLLNLFTYIEKYKFNLKVGSGSRFYGRFLEMFHRNQQEIAARMPVPMVEDAPETRKALKKKKRTEKRDKSFAMQNKFSFDENPSTLESFSFIDAIKDIASPTVEKEKPGKSIDSSLVVTFSTTTEDRIVVDKSVDKIEVLPHHHDDSNSNYSFTEFYAREQLKIAAQKSPEEASFFKTPADRKSPGRSQATIEEISTVNNSPIELNDSLEEATIIENINPEVAPEPSGSLRNFVDPPEAENHFKYVKNPFAQVDMLPEFISIMEKKDNRKSVEIIREPEQKASARVLLTKEHCKILLAEKGQDFLNKQQTSNNIKMEFKWDKNGNFLDINGFPSDQSIFHCEMREFLYRVELENYEKQVEMSSQVPKGKEKIISYIKSNLGLLGKKNELKVFVVKKVLIEMLEAEKSFNFRKALKCRKTLNVTFMGVGGLCEGKDHITSLRKILLDLEKEKILVSNVLRDQIMSHIKYIFSTKNHGNYTKLLEDYGEFLSQKKHKARILPNPCSMILK